MSHAYAYVCGPVTAKRTWAIYRELVCLAVSNSVPSLRPGTPGLGRPGPPRPGPQGRRACTRSDASPRHDISTDAYSYIALRIRRARIRTCTYINIKLCRRRRLYTWDLCDKYNLPGTMRELQQLEPLRMKEEE